MLTVLLHFFKTFFERRREKNVADHILDLPHLETERLALKNDPDAIKSWHTHGPLNTDRVMRWAAFLLFASPLLAGLISPHFGQRVLQAWHFLEPWQEKILSGMCLATFGMRAIPSLIGSIVESVRRK